MLQVQQLTLSNQEKILINALSFQVDNGEILTLMGASGSGKSSLLSWLIGGLSPAFRATGKILIAQREVSNLPTEQRRIGILFQNDLLFPHWTVGQNLAFALTQTKNRATRREAVETALSQVGLADFFQRYPQTLSGGQRARISVLRTLLAQPEVLLLDEPFSQLDSTLRQQFREFVFTQIRERHIPALLVTHDAADIPQGGRVLSLHNEQKVAYAG